MSPTEKSRNMKKYYFISYSSQSGLNASLWNHWNRVIDCHPIEYLARMRKIESLENLAITFYQEIDEEMFLKYDKKLD